MPPAAVKQPAVRKKSARPSRRAAAGTDPRFPGLVRDPLTGLLISPLKPGQKPVSLAAINKALAEGL